MWLNDKGLIRGVSTEKQVGIRVFLAQNARFIMVLFQWKHYILKIQNFA